VAASARPRRAARERVVSPLELFYDLVVVTLVAAAATMRNSRAPHQPPSG